MRTPDRLLFVTSLPFLLWTPPTTSRDRNPFSWLINDELATILGITALGLHSAQHSTNPRCYALDALLRTAAPRANPYQSVVSSNRRQSSTHGPRPQGPCSQALQAQQR